MNVGLDVLRVVVRVLAAWSGVEGAHRLDDRLEVGERHVQSSRHLLELAVLEQLPGLGDGPEDEIVLADATRPELDDQALLE